jgi:tetratricopeptide (TPR) repeat protein
MNPAFNESWLDVSSSGSVTGTMEGSAKVAETGQRTALDEVPAVGRGMVNLTGCEVRLTPKPGLTANIISLRTRNSFDNPDIGTIVVRRLADEGATTVSLNTLNAPQKALSSFEKANNALTSEKPDIKKAAKELNKALKEYPQFSAAWDLMARVHLIEGRRDEGKECFQRAIDEEPKFVLPYLGIAQMAFQDADWPETSNWTEKVLAMDGTNPQALYWNGLSAFYLQKYDDCERSLSELYQAKSNQDIYPFGLFPLGVVHANNGKIQEAAEELNLYLQLMPPEQVPEGQRNELETQIKAWQEQGLVKFSDVEVGNGRDSKVEGSDYR